jgi:hypothetical protein
MADLIFPTENDVNGGTDEAGKAFTEERWRDLYRESFAAHLNKNMHGLNFRQSGLDYASASGFVCTFNAGVCFIDGYYCSLDSKNVTLSASDDFYVFAQLTESGDLVTGAQLIQQLQTSTTIPGKAVRIAELTTDATTVTAEAERGPTSPHFETGQYAGTAAAVTVYLGWRPSFVSIDTSGASGDWGDIWDGGTLRAGGASPGTITILNYGMTFSSAYSDSAHTWYWRALP